MVNTNKLKGKIVERCMNVEGVAKQIGIDTATLYRKLNNAGTFTIKETDLIANILKLNSQEAMAIFFSQYVA